VKIKRAIVEALDRTSELWEVEVTVVVDAETADEALAKVAGALRDDGRETTGLRLPTWGDARPSASKEEEQ
jgi:hypothetical protein